MYRLLIVIMFNIPLLQAMTRKYRPKPPYDSYRAIKDRKHEAAAVFKMILEQYPDIDPHDYKYQYGYHGWNQNLYITFISNHDGYTKYVFDFISLNKIIKKDF